MARITGTKNITPNTSGDQTISAPASDAKISLNINSVTGQVYIGNVAEQNAANVNNPAGYAYDPGDIYGTRAQRESGAVFVEGGVGIEKDLNVGGFIYGRVALANTSTERRPEGHQVSQR